MNIFNRLVISPCCNPDLDLESALAAYSALGFTQFEAFSSWANSALSLDVPAEEYKKLFEKYGMRVTSFHLSPITDEADSFDMAIKYAEFANAMGAEVVLYKAASRELYIQNAKRFLDTTAHLSIIPVVQNHFGTAVSTLDDVKEVTEGIADTTANVTNVGRMKNLLEVGHFHTAGVLWNEGYNYLGANRIALVHIKDQLGGLSVPFGTGEIDLKGMFKTLEADGYTGKYVVEMEVEDKENTLKYLQQAVEYIKNEVGL